LNRALALLLASGRRTTAGLLLLIGASFVIYATVRLAPGDAVDAISGFGTSPEQLAKLRAELGLDVGLVKGYVVWLGEAARGNFGVSLSYRTGEEVMVLVLPAFERTLTLCTFALLSAMVVALLGAVLLGDPGPKQQWLNGTLYLFTAVPSLVAAVIFIQIANFIVYEHFILQGFEPPDWFPLPGYVEGGLAMHSVFAGAVLFASDGLLVDLLNTLRSELSALRRAQFILAVKAKGARTAPHIVRNLIVPVVSGFAARLPIVLGGAVIVENVFTLDGAGYLLFEAAKARDFTVVIGVSVMFTVAVILVNILSDVVRAVVDPREVARGG